MSYLLNELLLYLIGAAILGALVGWLMRSCSCKKAISELRANLEGKINAQASEIKTQANEIENTRKQVIDYKTRYQTAQANYESQSGDLMLMTSRWQTTLEKAKQLPKHQKWIKNLQSKYQHTRAERNDFEGIACHYADLHSDANQKIKRLNKRVTDQESFKYRLDDMIGKVGRLNDRVTTSENYTKSLYGMIGQIQKKWRADRGNSNPAIQQELNSTKAQMYALQNESQTTISELQNLRNKDLAEQNTRNQEELSALRNRVRELEPLEGDLPGQDSKISRILDKVRLVGTSKNTVLGRTYKQINEIKLEASQKERVFVDTCEEKDAVIDDLREQLRTADNRAQAASSAAVQECKSKLASAEKELETAKQDVSLLKEHELTIESFKLKFKSLQEQATQPPRLKAEVKKAKPKPAAKPSKPAAGLKAPAKGLNIAAAKVKDDLQVVKGIGPVMEGKLNDFGVYSYEQLGRLTKNDVAQLAETLGSFPDRIDRDKWVSQSKKLHKKKYGEKID